MTVLPRVLTLCVLLAALIQDPQPSKPPKAPAPPDDAPPLVPVQQAPRTAIERRDLLQRFDEPNALEGVYHLIDFSHDATGQPAPADGYLAIGRHHLSIHLLAPGAGKVPAFQSAFRRYEISGESLVMTSLLGVHNDPSGEVLVEGKGLAAVRRFELIGTRLTLWGDGDTKMLFERIE